MRFQGAKRNSVERNLEGDASIERVSLNGVSLGALKTHFVWLGPNVQISSLQMTLPEGRLRGHGSVNLTNARPRYTLSGDLINLPWKGGELDLSGDLTTTGAGPDTLLNLRASGEFSGREIVANQDATFSSVSGKYAVSFESGWPRLQLSAVQAEQADEVWEGTGVSQKDGSLIFDLANGARQLRVLSTLDSSAGPPAPATLSSTAPH
jgi:hypothetical protein